MGDSSRAIPPRVRRAALDLVRRVIDPSSLVRALGATYGFRSLEDLSAALTSHDGPDAAADVHDAVAEAVVGASSGRRRYGPANRKAVVALQTDGGQANASRFAEPVLAAIPDEWFAKALSIGRIAVLEAEFTSLDPGVSDVGPTVDRLFERNGVPFRFEDGELIRTGDPVVATQAIQPTLAVLDDSRLADVRRHFEAALRDLGRADPEDAVDEARQAVEAVLIAYIVDRGHDLPSKHQANALFDAAVEAGLPRAAEEIILATPRYRGRTRAGHAGRPAIPPELAEPAVGSAAAAIVFVARHLPN